MEWNRSGTTGDAVNTITASLDLEVLQAEPCAPALHMGRLRPRIIPLGLGNDTRPLLLQSHSTCEERSGGTARQQLWSLRKTSLEGQQQRHSSRIAARSAHQEEDAAPERMAALYLQGQRSRLGSSGRARHVEDAYMDAPDSDDALLPDLVLLMLGGGEEAATGVGAEAEVKEAAEGAGTGEGAAMGNFRLRRQLGGGS
ncbi:hypothetical protein COCSUDRAFT_56563 [Coccomyxa subellipsoidea C-169]|uniref:Uncharacterized protein n=1 Tax=Coccomyxa subellipsoidea (strain C-169) TaxID=574566 RepID=I0YSH1_COCSC|nr:hypothetical protein COCSUDRAFT_56563 [Coccomyxa subellipsoidea C-169]EIE21340.1 hypothetical protein COCSUDRAFT_56563 [Coccomyxa subellipsoidea C-169]|eukprot:XP_005645884.1 hypothetical protein COCSUDRAFT_56563 [Coccomyxa subellipsoidea C-169]